jgi:hypothetical protein
MRGAQLQSFMRQLLEQDGHQPPSLFYSYFSFTVTGSLQGSQWRLGKAFPLSSSGIFGKFKPKLYV